MGARGTQAARQIPKLVAIAHRESDFQVPVPQLGDLLFKAVRDSFPIGQTKRFFIPLKDLFRRQRNVGMQKLMVFGDAEDEFLGCPAVEYGLFPEFLNREPELNP